jgi:hypothetical protein
MTKSSFLVEHLEGVVCVHDLLGYNPKLGTCSVTNDAEAVIDFLLRSGQMQPGQRCIYRDSEGNWDEMVHDNGKFVSIRTIPLRLRSSREAAVMNILGKTEDRIFETFGFVAKEGCCEEASLMSHDAYIPCNAPASKLMFSARDRRVYRMCEACADHNTRRGMVEAG